MLVAEIFYSIQGEGALLGVPSVFVRTSGCNLRCAWCDTPYTSWQPEGQTLSLDSICETIAGFRARHAVITGGEPMIAKDIVELTNRLRSMGLHITIETAGTVFEPVVCDLMSISPKLANSTPAGDWHGRHDSLRIQPRVLSRLVRSYDHQLKFVVSQPEDLAEIAAILRLISADRSKVILMPEGIDPDLLRERGRWLAGICKQEGFRFSPRLHVDLYGNQRGT